MIRLKFQPMLTDWPTIIAKGEEVYEKSNGTVQLWPNIAEMVKVDAFSFDPLVRDSKLEITDDWIGMIDNMRTMYNSKAMQSWEAGVPNGRLPGMTAKSFSELCLPGISSLTGIRIKEMWVLQFLSTLPMKV